MRGQDDQRKSTFQQMYKSSIRTSYFAGIQEKKFVQKSKLNIENMEKDTEDIDETTFRLIRNFKVPENNFSVIQQSGKCHIQKDSIFSCFGKRKLYDMRLRNSKFQISYNEKISRFIEFDAVSSNIEASNKSFKITFQRLEQGGIYIEPQTKEKGQEEEITKTWIETLNKVIKQTEGKPKRYTYLARHSPDFYKSEQVLNEEFQRCANSGDILLFRSPHSAARLQRMFTDSEYDHVGIVLRNKKNQLFVYESTSTEGVGLTPWAHMIKYEWYDQTDKICWRQLHAKLGQRELDVIEAFVVKTLGKGFELGLDKMFQFKSKLTRSEEEEEKKTYFCSELAARLYKQLGFLDEQKSSTMYFPVDFSEKGSIKIVKPGVALGNEKIISFDGVKK